MHQVAAHAQEVAGVAPQLAALQSLPPAVRAVEGERGEAPVRHHLEDDVLCPGAALLAWVLHLCLSLSNIIFC